MTSELQAPIVSISFAWIMQHINVARARNSAIHIKIIVRKLNMMMTTLSCLNWTENQNLWPVEQRPRRFIYLLFFGVNFRKFHSRPAIFVWVSTHNRQSKNEANPKLYSRTTNIESQVAEFRVSGVELKCTIYTYYYANINSGTPHATSYTPIKNVFWTGEKSARETRTARAFRRLLLRCWVFAWCYLIFKEHAIYGYYLCVFSVNEHCTAHIYGASNFIPPPFGVSVWPTTTRSKRNFSRIDLSARESSDTNESKVSCCEVIGREREREGGRG